MKYPFLVAVCSLFFACSFAQSITGKLRAAYRQFEADPQLRHAVSSLYVINAKTGKVVFDKNSQTGLAAASTQKIVTAVTAFELLGKAYRFKTVFINDAGALYVAGFGDPTLGSWRFNQTKDTVLFAKFINELKKAGIKNYTKLIVYDNLLDKIPPSGWISEDIGNYYGAAAHDFNWRENQYDLGFFPGKRSGDPAEIDTSSTSEWWTILNACKTGPPGSGDNAYIYFVPGRQFRIVNGTVPAGVDRFSISGADPEPNKGFSLSFMKYSAAKGFFNGETDNYTIAPWHRADSSLIKSAIYTHYSPSLDSIIYWLLKKSINLYGESLVRTLAYEKKGFGSTDTGIAIIKDFWKQKGLEESEINVCDGSGLSPLNRVTTHAQVEILKYAKTRDWFTYFYNSLPEYNGMKIKSGTISGVKGFCGYHKAKDGNEYIFSFLVNNYNGSASAVVGKMYKVLDIFK